jgi:HSP20 family protein
MAEQTGKVPVKTEGKGKAAAPAPAAGAEPARHPLVSLRQEIDRLFEDFASSFSLFPLSRRLFEEPVWRMPGVFAITTPAVDVAENERAFEITAELPGLAEKDIELTLSNDILTIKGEKSEEKEEKKKDYYLSERRYGSFQRSFRLPEGVDADKIEAAFKNGVLTITLPKTAEAQKKLRKIEVKGK